MTGSKWLILVGVVTFALILAGMAWTVGGSQRYTPVAEVETTVANTTSSEPSTITSLPTTTSTIFTTTTKPKGSLVITPLVTSTSTRMSWSSSVLSAMSRPGPGWMAFSSTTT